MAFCIYFGNKLATATSYLLLQIKIPATNYLIAFESKSGSFDQIDCVLFLLPSLNFYDAFTRLGKDLLNTSTSLRSSAVKLCGVITHFDSSKPRL